MGREAPGAGGAALAWAWLLAGACAAIPYSPCPVEGPRPLPDDAFDRCRAVLMARFGAIEIADRDGFRLQTAWCPIADPPGERRATLFRDGDGDRLGIVVELRWLSVSWFGLPTWTAPGGDPQAERALAAALEAALSAS